MNERTYVLLLNWNGFKDTIECLESVFRSDHSCFRVVVCDNDSTDGSMEQIKAWAEGKMEWNSPSGNPLGQSVGIPKPLVYQEYNRLQAEAGGPPSDIRAPLILIHTGANLGFAGGYNVGLRYILARDDFDYAWLLNNDTVVHPEALSHLLRRMHQRPVAGMCGSTLIYYHQPDKIQALGGGCFNRWFGLSKQIGMLRLVSDPVDLGQIEKKMFYVSGASMFVSRFFLKDVGLLGEDYFLYFEEIDWAIRAQGKYHLSYAQDSIVYHKEGASLGSSSKPKEKSFKSDYYGIKNRIVLTRKFFPLALPTVYLGLFIAILNRVLRGQWDRVFMIFKILIKSSIC